MAKEVGGKAPLVSPLYESGRMNGPVAGPKGGIATPDPMNYLNSPGKLPVPSGNIKDREVQNTGRGDKDQSPNRKGSF